jgi:hypothetical protein
LHIKGGIGMKHVDIKLYRNLGYAVVLRAVMDFFSAREKDKAKILKDLNSPWCDWLSNGLSVIAATELQTNPGKIKRALIKACKNGLVEEEELK